MSKRDAKEALVLLFRWKFVGWATAILIGVGVGALSMTPPEARFAIVCFSAAFLLLAYKLSSWILLEQNGSTQAQLMQFLIVLTFCGGLWFFCFMAAKSKLPHNGPQILTFNSFSTSVGNMPERKVVTNTWNGKPWDEDRYADIRLDIINNSEYQIQNVDLTVGMEQTKGDDSLNCVIAGIDQLSQRWVST